MMPQSLPSKESASRIQITEAREKLAPVRDNVLNRDLIKFSEEGPKPCAKQVAQLADTNQGACVGIGVEALDEFEISLRVPDNFPDNDFVRRHGQPDAASASANIIKIAKLAELPGCLEQMGFGDSISARHIFDTHEPIRVKRTEH
jgi:hypothetical protein